MTVINIGRISAYRENMQALGFISHGDYSNINEEYFTEDLPSGERISSIHVFQVGNPEIKRHIDFRDYLSFNEAARNLYIDTKRALYKDYRSHYRAYDSGKQAVIDQLNREAAEWALVKSSTTDVW